MGYQIKFNNQTYKLNYTNQNYTILNNGGLYSVAPIIDLSSYLKIKNVKAGTGINVIQSLTGVTITSTSTGTITGATNGLKVNSKNNVGLGGSLTGATTIGLGTNNLTFSGSTGQLQITAMNTSLKYSNTGTALAGYESWSNGSLGAFLKSSNTTLEAQVGGASTYFISFYSNGALAGNLSTKGDLLLSTSAVVGATPAAKFELQQNALTTTGGLPIIKATGGAHTSLTKSIELNDVYFNLNRTVQFSGGALPLQRAVRISAPIYSFVTASTLTNAYTFYVDGAPTGGTNATVTNKYAAGFGGNVAINNNLSALYFNNSAATNYGSIIYNIGTNFLTTNYQWVNNWTQSGIEKMRLSNISNLLLGSTTDNAKLYVSQAQLTSSFVPALRIDAGNHKSYKPLEYPDAIFNGSAGRYIQYTGGTVTQQRFNVFNGTIITGSSSTTLNNVYTAYFGQPTGGTNVTIIKNYAAGFAGNISLVNAGNKIYIKEGTNASSGVATLTAGSVVVSTTSVTANSRIQLTIQSLGTVTVPKAIGVTARTAGTSFTITSADATDTSLISWLLIEPA
jgi:hypothetical protein